MAESEAAPKFAPFIGMVRLPLVQREMDMQF
jgi:hypothetical protein